jgi:hypothetical protein
MNNRKLSTEEVTRIKALLDEGRLLQYKIARQFGVDPAIVSRIKNGCYQDRTRRTNRCFTGTEPHHE